jgi:hypothetical protein
MTHNLDNINLHESRDLVGRGWNLLTSAILQRNHIAVLPDHAHLGVVPVYVFVVLLHEDVPQNVDRDVLRVFQQS